MNKVIPAVVIKNKTDGTRKPYVLILNNGVVQGSIYKGLFTKNDKCTSRSPLLLPMKPFTILMQWEVRTRLDVATPYPGRLLSAKVPRVIAQEVKAQMLHKSAFTGLSGDVTATQVESTEWRPAFVGRYANQAASQEIIGNVQAATPGYVTEDVRSTLIGSLIASSIFLDLI